ncbi:helix-turn-helix domain-containing protein [Lactococcus lactis]|uniref:helix-turn-helix domain-containing protein n=1 Tax=Lactococcus lactis TaxID=1358 RepID=UPI00223B5ADC|nr:helix-turn-helix domain-containing protein [Lactococcus lactis]MCT1172453.1 helix-turn-helix domain-containing protein [Lactococcus lactis]MDM7509925.1 helix-turn-helix domain-containing protein [Lactococcus lactis]MDY5175458.1 helix-turn-helix domain-containing protein [Lactococcus lactis]
MTKNRIKELRKAKGLTLSSLVESLVEKGVKVNESQLSKFEKGTSSPRNDDIWVTLAEIFDVSLGYVMGIDGNAGRFYKDERIYDFSEYDDDGNLIEENIRSISMTEASERMGRSKFERYLKFINQSNFIMSDRDLLLLWDIINNFNENRSDSKYNILNELGGKSTKESQKILSEKGYHFLANQWKWDEDGVNIEFTDKKVDHPEVND